MVETAKVSPNGRNPMKAEAERLKVRTGLSQIETDWKRTQKAAKVVGVPVSQFIRDAVNGAAISATAKKGGAK